MKLPRVVIIGRPNVGKSTLFNKILERYYAITSNIPKTTRTPNEAIAEWQGIYFELVDTAGFDFDFKKDLDKLIFNRVKLEIKKADILLVLIDVKVPVNILDEKIIKLAKRSNKPKILVINKVDNPRLREKANLIGTFGFKYINFISSANGSGVGDLLDRVILMIKNYYPKKIIKSFDLEKFIKIALIGRPNVGKSSIFNILCNENKAIVYKDPHTTIDRYETILEFNNKKILLIDTGGIRRKSKIPRNSEIEKKAVKSAFNAIKISDISILILDIKEGITRQDIRLANQIVNNKKGILILGNKFDLISNQNFNTINEFETYIKKKIPRLSFAPIILTSAIKKMNIDLILPKALKVYENLHTKINKKDLKIFIGVAQKKMLPIKGKGTKYPKILDFYQSSSFPPKFELVINKNAYLDEAYINYLKNLMYEVFDLEGVPISIYVRY